MKDLLLILDKTRSLIQAGDMAGAFAELLRSKTDLPIWAIAAIEKLKEQWEALLQKQISHTIPPGEADQEEQRLRQALADTIDDLERLLSPPIPAPPASPVPGPPPRSARPRSAWETLVVDPIREMLKKTRSIPKMVENEPPSSGAEPPEEVIAPQPVTPTRDTGEEKPENAGPAALQNLQPETPGDTVVCSAFAPPQAKPGEDIMVQVWAHLPEKREEAITYAAGFDPGAVMRQFRTLSAPFEKGDEITFVLSAKGIEIENNSQNLTWTGQTESVQFVVSVPNGFAGSKLFFTLTAFKNTIPVGQLLFTMGISQTPETEPAPLGDEARRFRKAFVSYSSKDRPEVLRRVQMLGMFDVDYFMDLLSLEPGERWEKGLYKNIDSCDVFLLFWSGNAKASKWVLQELEYALARKQGDPNNPPMIQPVPIEGPPIVSPPPQLGHMHFNDKILYFIAAGSGKP